MYRIHNACDEIPELEYDDGLEFIYFNTKGQKCGSQAIKNMLTYIQNSDSINAVDDATRMIDSYVEKVKNLPEVEAGFMTLGDWVDGIVEDAVEEAVAEVKEKMREELRAEVKAEVTKSVTDEVTRTVTDEVRAHDIQIVIETFREYGDTKENAVVKLRKKFPAYADHAVELVEKYWK